MDRAADAFEDVRFELLELEPIDETGCLTIQRLRGRFRNTGIEVDGAWGAIVTVRGDKVMSAPRACHARPRQEGGGRDLCRGRRCLVSVQEN